MEDIISEIQELYKVLNVGLDGIEYVDLGLEVTIRASSKSYIFVEYNILENGHKRGRYIPIRAHTDLQDENMHDVLITVIKKEVENGVLENVNI